MSLILEALKKLDREKAFIRKVTANIADEILKTDPIRPRKRFPLYFTAVLLTVCVTAALTYVVISNVGLLAKKPPSASSNHPGTSRPNESPPPSPAPAQEAQEEMFSPSSKDQNIAESKMPTKAESLLAPKPSIGKQSSQQFESVPPLRESKRADQDKMPLPSSKSPIVAESKASLGTESMPDPKPSAAKKPPQQIEPPPLQKPAREAQEGTPPVSGKDKDWAANQQISSLPTASPSLLRLTGIVWSEDPSGRRAVINGAIVNEGTVIQGSKVVEILPNRVRLMQDGRPFEIRLF